MAYADKDLTCRECGTSFAFTASEQEFYASRGLENEPGRCPDCRAARKAQRGGGSGSYSSGGGRGGWGPQPNLEAHKKSSAPAICRPPVILAAAAILSPPDWFLVGSM